MSKLKKLVTWPPPDPFWPNFAFFRVRTHSIRLRAKFEVSSFNHSRGIKGFSKIAKLGHVTPHDQFWPNFAFFSLELTAVRLFAKFEVFRFNRLRDIRGSTISKIGPRGPNMTPFDPILHFFVRRHLRPSPCQIWSF